MKPMAGFWRLAVPVALLLAASGSSVSCGILAGEEDPADVEQWFRDHLPDDPTRDQVERLLVDEGITYDIVDARYESPLRDRGIAPDVKVVRALVPGKSGAIVDQDFNVFFVLGDNDLVSDIVVHEVFTGP